MLNRHGYMVAPGDLSYDKHLRYIRVKELDGNTTLMTVEHLNKLPYQ